MNLGAGEIGAIVVGLLVGYWAIGAVMSGLNKPAAAKRAPAPPPATPTRAPIPPTWNEVLGIEAGASPEDIRAAYRRQMALHHPDKVASLGAEIRATAERMSKLITGAYREGMRRHGLEPE
jgi:hypothetical protein